MLSLDIPGFNPLRLENLIIDYNGTLACDGELLPGTRERLRELAAALEIHVLTADTFGKVRQQLEDLPLEIQVLEGSPEDRAKLTYLQKLGPSVTVAIGNGRNDRLMLHSAALGIAVIGPEGASREAVESAHLMVHGIDTALDLLRRPLRIKATLRD